MRINILVAATLLSMMVLTTLGQIQAAEKSKSVPAREVEFFDGIKEGVIEVKFTAKNSLDTQMTLKNKTNEPIVVKKPTTFALVPPDSLVLKQFDDGGMFGDPGGGRGRGGSSSTDGGYSSSSSSSGGGNQSMGGGMGGMGSMGGMGGGGMGGMGGGGMWNVAPEKSVKENLRTVCLEHGKREPHPGIKYQAVPLEYVAKKPEVAVLCSLIGTGRMDQKSGQAAVWHLNNNMSWQQLASKTIKSTYELQPRPYFTQQQMMLAHNTVLKATKFVKDSEQNKSKSTETSTSTSKSVE